MFVDAWQLAYYSSSLGVCMFLVGVVFGLLLPVLLRSVERFEGEIDRHASAVRCKAIIEESWRVSGSEHWGE
jgi:hypothetical protein